MRDRFMSRKKKDLLQVTLIIILLFAYAFYENQRKNSTRNYNIPELASPEPSLTGTSTAKMSPY